MKDIAEEIVGIIQLVLFAIGIGAVLGITFAVAYSVFMWYIK